MAWTAVAVVRLAQAARARGTMRVGALNKPEDQQASFRERYSGCASSRKVLWPRRSASVCAVSVLIGRTTLGMHSSAAANMNASRRGAMQTLSAQ